MEINANAAMIVTNAFFQAVMSVNLFDWFAGSVLGIYETMEHFTGHKK